MNKIYHEEEQKFSQLKWLWVMIFLPLIIILVLATKGLDQEASTGMLLGIAPAYVVMIAMLIASKLQIRVADEGLYYRFFPRVMKWRFVPKQSIASFEVKKRTTFFHKIACGYHRSPLKNSVFMNITGKQVLSIRLADGKKLLIGSENADTMHWALKRITTAAGNE